MAPTLPPPTDPRERFEWTCKVLFDVIHSAEVFDTMLNLSVPRDYPRAKSQAS